MSSVAGLASTRPRLALFAAAAVVAVIVLRRRRRREWRLEDKLTVVISTSPTRTNPSTLLIEETVGSVRHHAPDLTKCPTIVICDGYKVKPEPRYRSGQVTAEGGVLYEEYLNKVRKLKFGRVIVCKERQGFGFALKHALEYVKTPYVIVIQHDRNFIRDVDVEQVVRSMEANSSWLKYVHFPTSSTINYARLMLSKYGLRIERRVAGGLELWPLLQWYDSTHVCEVAHYRGFVFRGDLVKKGGFVEDKLGQHQLAHIRTTGLAAHAEYGTFVVDAQGEPVVAHLDGHDRLAYRKFKFVDPGPEDLFPLEGPPPDVAASIASVAAPAAEPDAQPTR
ncbi:hypothetical protein M885DRAFT_566220 [Pelagophyceae sp. CCMP2097]|nr:hypothetical protein M885DRAFT_566220 [Pelagophyceae sp. CCMP2097]|mmetsp:Transcript_22610/g.76403  ORF Transcript_22610/g.76403 Transcript_22610/m.76403 type:complete len:336 (+) Transcript_22610:67-1074(+)